uniref:Uncharacterized protein n=1 Tax=Anguilla anguilla TaxID=7936 RepID=A0A0E9RWR5_ANGAN
MNAILNSFFGPQVLDSAISEQLASSAEVAVSLEAVCEKFIQPFN